MAAIRAYLLQRPPSLFENPQLPVSVNMANYFSSGESPLSMDPFTHSVVHPLHPSKLFDVEGLVVVITGGGTGK